MSLCFFRWVCILPWLGLAAMASAQAPSSNVPQDYWLTAKHGQYLIYMASFRGDEAQALAVDLVAELRKTHKLPAYIFRRIDEDALAEKERLRQETIRRYGPDAVKNMKKVMVLEEFAVVLGHYATQEAARKDLDRIKKVPKPAHLPIFSSLQVWTDPRNKDEKGQMYGVGDQIKENKFDTFSFAFVTRNPLVPKMAQPAQDQALQILNQSEKFSLLNCKKPFTLVVMEFRAPVDIKDHKPSVFDQSPLLSGSKSPYAPSERYLEHSLTLARRLSEVLSDNGKGYETYLLHTRHSTLVTVGGFDGPQDPKLLETKKQLAGMEVAGIKLLNVPYPCKVPR